MDFARSLGCFLGDQSGGNFILVALTFPVIFGMAGLGLDAAMWYMDKRQDQNIADSAAAVGAIAVARGAGISQSALEAIVRDSTAANGFVHGTHGTVLVNSPPAAGPNAGTPGFVEVLVEEQGKLYFSQMLRSAPITIQARSVGGISTFGQHCVLALDPVADGAVTITGTADVISDCGIASNSNSEEAILVAGNATLTAQPLQAYGDIAESGNATITHHTPPQPLSERVDDPYAGVLKNLQASPSCVGANSTNFKTADSPLSPGRYCGGIQINGNVDFLPGTYILDNGGLKISGGGDIRGQGVTFILTAMDAADLGTFDLSGGGLVDLRAPVDTSEGEYPGMLVIQDPYVPGVENAVPAVNKFTGGANMRLAGALYLPHQEVAYSGGTNGGANCTLIVAAKVSFHGNVNLHNDATSCAEAGVNSGIQQTRVRIME